VGQGRTQAASARCQRPRKRGPDLGRVWVVSDATAIRIGDAWPHWTAVLSVMPHPDARAQDRHRVGDALRPSPVDRRKFNAKSDHLLSVYIGPWIRKWYLFTAHPFASGCPSGPMHIFLSNCFCFVFHLNIETLHKLLHSLKHG
jgi:hypothetical protein